MTNLTSEDRIYDEAGPSYDSNTPYEVQDHDTFVNHLDEYHEYVEDNEDHVVQRNVSSVRNDALMSILDEMHEQGVQSRLANKNHMIINDSVTSELARYKELVGEYEKSKKQGSNSYKNPLCLTRASKALLTLYNGLYLSTSNLTPLFILCSEDHGGKIAEDIIGIKNAVENAKPSMECIETVREIVEEARGVKPLDNTLNYACQYTKLSQELLEYVIGTCPKSFNERDNKAPSTPVTRKKQVTFRVNDSTEASGSQPRSNTKKNRILPVKKENKKEVEVHLRTNKSIWTKVNRVDSSISSKRVVINSNSKSVCKTCNTCLSSASHEICVVHILNSVNATSTIKIVLNKGKQIWKPKGRLSDNSLCKTKRVWKATGKLFIDIGYQ
ncbi:hypothetical protein Tco_0895542 [Tanacetum coccineum]|uniref:Uncharacterized protein n=1 Tax=Tanacetum coccineum TaxID=301880 RepID=A0ABQ5CEX4_9ASTR